LRGRRDGAGPQEAEGSPSSCGRERGKPKRKRKARPTGGGSSVREAPKVPPSRKKWEKRGGPRPKGRGGMPPFPRRQVGKLKGGLSEAGPARRAGKSRKAALVPKGGKRTGRPSKIGNPLLRGSQSSAVRTNPEKKKSFLFLGRGGETILRLEY